MNTIHSALETDGITLPPFISEGMVLQRDADLPLFGGCLKDGRVTISFLDQIFTSSCINGKWQIYLPPLKAGGPWPLTIKKGNEIVSFNEVYVGDVWLASGQSNMEQEYDFSNENIDPQNIRMLSYSSTPKSTQWDTVSTDPIFSKVGGYFAQKIYEDVQVPIGIINAAQGGTPILCWQKEGNCYLDHIQPFQGMAMRGVIWWQGESDAFVGWGGPPEEYAADFSIMIEQWRENWQRGDFPFLYIQLQRYQPLEGWVTFENGWAKIREEQRKSLSTENTAMVVSFDLTDGDVHPVNKEPIASRLVLAARALAYDEMIEYSGPFYLNAFYEKDEIVIQFSHAEGLVSCDGEPLRDFELLDANGSLNPAEPKIEDGQIVIPVDGLQGPFVVKYGYKDYPLGNLCNQINLPASPFVTEVISSF